jgi:uncharacterized protein YjdB
MTITQHISIDLQQPGNAPMIHAVQGDEYTRVVEIDLYSGGVSWNPPSGCEVAIRYGKPDGKGGIYGVLPDNTPAYSIAGNAITVTLAPQMVTVPGMVEVQVSIIKDRKDRLSTFSFAIDVEADPSKGELKSENYVNWKSYYIPQTTGASVGQYLKITEVDADGRVTAVEAVDSPSGGNGSDSSQNVAWMYVTVEVDEEIPCTGIALDKSALTFNGAGQKTIIATVTPADTTDVVTWTSNNQKVATVSNGVVTVFANGSATITATCGDYSATCTVQVSGISETVAVTGITLNKNTATVQAGSTITLTAIVKPDNATNKTVLWSSDNETVAKVVNGVVTGISEGTASIGAMTADGGFSAVCNVTVAAASNYKNLFDKDTMVTANQGVTGAGVIGSYNWGLARVPVKENTVYSIKVSDDYDGSGIQVKEEPGYYNGATVGAFGFADETGDTLISRLSFSNSQSIVDAGTNGINALLQNYSHADSDEVDAGYVYWVTFTTPAGCAYLLFNTTLKNNADKIQLEEGDTIHDYYLAYDGGAE